MKLENKGLSVSVFIITLSIIFFFGGVWMFSKFYISPFLESDVKMVMADPLIAVSFLMGGSIGMIIITPINVASRLFRSRELKVKTIFISMLSLGVIGGGANLALYKFVIEPNNMYECPLKVGYKKNLMRDYVTDLSLCEKF